VGGVAGSTSLSTSGPPVTRTTVDPALWRSVAGLLEGADVAGIRANKLGPLAARVLLQQGRPVPQPLADDARLATLSWMTAVPLLGRIRALCDGPLLLIKGAEVAALYPGRARAFMDIDLISPDAHAAHAALREAGFVEVEDPELFVDHHHLRPLQCPGLWLTVEIHMRPMWPPELVPPPLEEIVAAAVPSATGVPGVLAPAPEHHAVILASHAWVHEPLHSVRDLLDIAAVAAVADARAVADTASRWGLERIWRTSYGAATGLLGDTGRTPALRIWGRHLLTVRERSVMGNHLQRWLHTFSERPFPAALRASVSVLRQEFLPDPGESWRDKLIRVRHAFTHPRDPLSTHTEAWQARARGTDEDPS
jgi:hypothetical protein